MIDTKKFFELLEIQKERQLAMHELSQILEQDISFSDEEVLKFAAEEFIKHTNKEVMSWMKSALS